MSEALNRILKAESPLTLAGVPAGFLPWLVADAGSKNGSWLDSETLTPRKERALTSRAVLRIGDVDLTFYVASDLYSALGGAG